MLRNHRHGQSSFLLAPFIFSLGLGLVVLPALASEPVIANPIVAQPMVINVSDFGAKGNGIADDTQALQNALNSLSPNATLNFGVNKTYLHSKVLYLQKSGVRLTGKNVNIVAVKQDESAFMVKNVTNVTIDNLTFTARNVTHRWAEYEKMKLCVLGSSNIKLTNITVNGAGAAGIYLGRVKNFRIDQARVSNTRSDGIHLTEGTNHGVLTHPVIANSGDDGVAVVSYNDGNPVSNNITIYSPRLYGQTGGRAFAVVGGDRIFWNDIYAKNSNAAGLYLASEREWNTLPVTNIVVTGGKLLNSNQNKTIDHGSIVLYGSQPNTNNYNINIRNLTIINTRPTVSRNVSIIVWNKSLFNNVKMSNINIINGPKTNFWTNLPVMNNQPGPQNLAYSLTNWTKNKVALFNQYH